MKSHKRKKRTKNQPLALGPYFPKVKKTAAPETAAPIFALPPPPEWNDYLQYYSLWGFSLFFLSITLFLGPTGTALFLLSVGGVAYCLFKEEIDTLINRHEYVIPITLCVYVLSGFNIFGLGAGLMTGYFVNLQYLRARDVAMSVANSTNAIRHPITFTQQKATNLWQWLKNTANNTYQWLSNDKKNNKPNRNKRKENNRPGTKVAAKKLKSSLSSASQSQSHSSESEGLEGLDESAEVMIEQPIAPKKIPHTDAKPLTVAFDHQRRPTLSTTVKTQNRRPNTPLSPGVSKKIRNEGFWL